MMINLQVHPLLFTIFLISNAIDDQCIKVSCLNIKLIPSFKVSEELLLRYK